MEVKYSKDCLGGGESTNILDPNNSIIYFLISRKTTKRTGKKLTENKENIKNI